MPTPEVTSISAEPDVVPAAAVSNVVDSVQIPVPVGEIRDADYPRLKAVLAQLKAGLETSSRSLAQLQRTTRRKPVKPVIEERSPFDFAYAQVRACEVALRNSIEAASLATPESAAKLQAKVAENYEAYARAVIVAKSTARTALADNSGSLR